MNFRTLLLTTIIYVISNPIFANTSISQEPLIVKNVTNSRFEIPPSTKLGLINNANDIESTNIRLLTQIKTQPENYYSYDNLNKSLFHQKILPPGSNARPNDAFLPTLEKSIEANLYQEKRANLVR